MHQVTTAASEHRILHNLFEHQVRENPSRVALICNGEKVTYKDLNRRANWLACTLRRVGVKRETIVGVLLARSIDAVTVILAILKAGGAYLPMDPAAGPEHLNFVIRDSQLPILVTKGPSIESYQNDIKVVDIVDLESEPIAQDAAEVQPSCRPDDAACIIYTSGSTGSSKGVIKTHGSIAASLTYGYVQPDDVFGHVLSFSYGYSIRPLFLALKFGIPLVIFTEDTTKDLNAVIRTVESEKVTQIFLVPSFLLQFINVVSHRSSKLIRLNAVTVGGEPLTNELAKSFVDVMPKTKLFNQYAATETGPVAIEEICRGGGVINVAIGQPVEGVELRILDSHMQAVPIGEVGEVYVGGVQLARGYLHRPELTAERFIERDSSLPSRLFRTGDRARYTSDRRIEIMGRVDRQTKIRGFRVELEEIEAALRTHAAIAEVVVIAQDFIAHKRLVAYIVPSNGRTTTPTELRQYLTGRIPEYMIPAVFVTVNELPRSASGKIHPASLPIPRQTRPDLDTPYRPPQDEVETTLTRIWEDVLQINGIGIDDDFIELGGDSLYVMQMLSAAEASLGVELSQAELFRRPTIAFIGQEVQRQLNGKQTFQRTRETTSSNLRVSFSQETQLLAELRAKLFLLDLRQGRTWHGLRLVGEVDCHALEHAINRIVDRHTILRTSYSHMPSVDPVQPGRGYFFSQTVHDRSPVAISPISIESSSAEGVTHEIRRIVMEMMGARFDYGFPPHVRTALLKIAQNEHLLITMMPTLVSDKSSLWIFEQELRTLYSAQLRRTSPLLPPLQMQFSDFCIRQRQQFTKERLTRLYADCSRQLLDYPYFNATELSFSKKPDDVSFATGRVARKMATDLSAKIRLFARQRRVTLYVLQLTAFVTLLHVLSGKERIGLRCFCAGRSRAYTWQLIGPFATAYLLGLHISSTSTISSLIEQVHQVVIDATTQHGWGAPPAGSTARADNPKTSGPNPYITFDLVKNPAPYSAGGVQFEKFVLPIINAPTALAVAVHDNDDATIVLNAQYRIGLFEELHISQLLEALEKISAKIILEPNDPVSSFSAVGQLLK